MPVGSIGFINSNYSKGYIFGTEQLPTITNIQIKTHYSSWPWYRVVCHQDYDIYHRFLPKSDWYEWVNLSRSYLQKRKVSIFLLLIAFTLFLPELIFSHKTNIYFSMSSHYLPVPTKWTRLANLKIFLLHASSSTFTHDTLCVAKFHGCG